jgi:3D-(3,5/4)-trihydroxycyclohexane-1,2-dione acylhydrolase (decyclizing)
MIVLVCDNGGFGVINRLQNGKGGASFNNLLKDSKVKEAFPVDFVRHAESMGALARRADTLDQLRDALKWAKSNDRTTVISIVTDAFAWTPGDAWWDVGVPQVSEREEVQAARKDQEKGRTKQRIGV